MKLSDFAPEFDPADLPTIVGAPMDNAPVAALIAAKGTAYRVDESLMNLLTGAVHSFYFAKHACSAIDTLSKQQSGALKNGIVEVRTSLLKAAVLGIATTIDVTNGQTESLPHALEALKIDLTARKAQQPRDEIDAALDLLNYVRLQTDAGRVDSLKYVRHLRNKWAGHSSLDRTVDGWAGADTTVDFRILEDALARMVNAFQDLATLVPMSQDLEDIQAQGNPPKVLPDGTIKIEMKVAWSGANSIAQAMREAGKAAAAAFIDLLSQSSVTD